MTMMTPAEAKQKLCPLSRTFIGGAVAGCRGDDCMVWHWEAITTKHPLWAPAVQARAAETGEKPPYAKASAWVAENKAALGMVQKRGFCGIGGQP